MQIRTPEWVSAELETGYEDYWEYRGDGGHDPATEPAAHGYIHFANGVRGFYVGGPKTAQKMLRLEIVGTKGFIFIEDAFTEPRAQIRTSDKYEEIHIPTWDVIGIPAGVQELIHVVDEGGEPVSPGRAGRKVVEIILGFLDSNRHNNAKVKIPSPTRIIHYHIRLRLLNSRRRQKTFRLGRFLLVALPLLVYNTVD